MAQKFAYFLETFWMETCCKCKTRFAMSDAIHATALERRNKFEFFCPNGHPQFYASQQQMDEDERTRQERDRLKQKVAELEDDARAATNRAERAKKEIARIKKRALAGVCPCCNRTFANVARHIASKHKGEKVEA